jgi:DNA-binding MarR family transcriptional regulator
MAQKNNRIEIINQLLVLGEIYSTETALFHQLAASLLGLSASDMKTLSILSQEGPLTAGDVTKRLGLTTGAVTSVINRLEKRGFISRKQDKQDLRKVILAINDDKLKKSNEIYSSIGGAFTELYNGYTIEQLNFLIKYHNDATSIVHQEVEKLQT